MRLFSNLTSRSLAFCFSPTGCHFLPPPSLCSCCSLSLDGPQLCQLKPYLSFGVSANSVFPMKHFSGLPTPSLGGFPPSSVGKESTCNGGDPSSIPGVGKIPWRRDRLHTPVFLGFPGGSAGKESTCNAGELGSSPGLGRPLEKGKAPHSSILAWRIPWTVQCTGWQRVGHDGATVPFTAPCVL